MEIRIVGTQIWLNNTLMSEGLSGPAYAAELRRVEELARDTPKAFSYNAGFNDGHLAGRIAERQLRLKETTYAPEPQPQSAT